MKELFRVPGYTILWGSHSGRLIACNDVSGDYLLYGFYDWMKDAQTTARELFAHGVPDPFKL